MISTTYLSIYVLTKDFIPLHSLINISISYNVHSWCLLRPSPFDVSCHSSHLLHYQIKSKKFPETFSATRKVDKEKVLHQPFSSLSGNSKQSNQLRRPVLSLIFFSIAMLSSNTANAFDYNGTCTPFFKTISGFLMVWDLLHP